MMIMFLHVAGMDAEVSYAFHSERKRNPEKFKNQLTNQVSFFVFFRRRSPSYPMLSIRQMTS